MVGGAAVGVGWAGPAAILAGFGLALAAAVAWLGAATDGRKTLAAIAAAAALALAGAAVRALPVAALARLDGRLAAVRAVVLRVPEAAGGRSIADVRIEALDGRSTSPVAARASFAADDAPAIGDERVGVGRLRIDAPAARVHFRDARTVGRRALPVRRLLEGLRGRLAASLRAALEGSSEREWAVAAALGLRGGVEAADAAAFRRSGATHLLALSGLNVGVVAAAVWGLAGAAGLRRRPRAVATIALIALYAAATGATPSVVRAAVMASAFFVADLLGRASDPLRSLAAAAVATLALDPLAVADVGFQLSYAAAFAILHVVPALRPRLRPLGPMGDLVAASAAAQGATAPLTALHFGQVSIVGLASNLLLVPLFGAIVPLALIVAVAGLVWPAGAEAAGTLLGGLLAAARLAIEASAAVPYAAVHVPPPGPAVLLLAAAAVVLAPAALAAGAGRAPRAALAAAVAALVLLGARAVAAIDDGRLRILCLDGAALVHARDGRRALVLGDAAPGAVVGPLARRGLNRLDEVVVAGRIDRARALRDVVDEFDVRRVAFRPPPVGPDAARLARALRDEGAEAAALPDGVTRAAAAGLVGAYAAAGPFVALVVAEGPRTAGGGAAAVPVPAVEVACGRPASVRTLEPGEAAVVDRPGGPWRFEAAPR